MVPADTSVSVATADVPCWEIEGMECLSGSNWEGDFLQVNEQGVKPIQAVGSGDVY